MRDGVNKISPDFETKNANEVPLYAGSSLKVLVTLKPVQKDPKIVLTFLRRRALCKIIRPGKYYECYCVPFLNGNSAKL